MGAGCLMGSGPAAYCTFAPLQCVGAGCIVGSNPAAYYIFAPLQEGGAGCLMGAGSVKASTCETLFDMLVSTNSSCPHLSLHFWLRLPLHFPLR